MPSLIDFFSSMATGTSCFIQIPLIIQIHKNRHADNISYYYISANFLCALSWFFYGILISSQTLIISDIIYFAMYLIILWQKIYYNRLRKLLENNETVNNKYVIRDKNNP